MLVLIAFFAGLICGTVILCLVFIASEADDGRDKQ